MQFRSVTGHEPSADDLLTLADVKRYMGVVVTDEDALISSIIAAVAAQMDGPDSIIGRSLSNQRLEITLDDFPNQELSACIWPGTINLHNPPVVDIVSVTYHDTDGDEQTLPSSEYRIWRAMGRASLDTGAIGQTWPETDKSPDNVSIIYNTGGEIPQPVKVASMMMCQHLYDHRDAVMMRSAGEAYMPASRTALVTSGAMENPAIYRLLHPYSFKAYAV